ncbi:MAG: hypothetical protein JSW33_16395 [bacterium]|nr:MAG: hypothetical protein JSW33_16395 [bacterium]
MTKREFVKLKKGDILLAIRHILDDQGRVSISENSEWRVIKIDHLPTQGESKKTTKAIEVVNLSAPQKLIITKENSTNFVVYKRRRGPVPKEEV